MLWAHKALRVFSDCLIDDSIDDDDRKYFVAAWASTHSRSRSRGARALRTPFAPSRSSSSATTHEDGRAARDDIKKYESYTRWCSTVRVIAPLPGPQ